MGNAIGSVLPLGIGMALSPPTIIHAVLLLSTPRGRANGTAFLVGWILGLAVVGTLALVLANLAWASDHGHPAAWVGTVELVLGAGLVLLAILQWHSSSGSGQERLLSRRLATLDTFSPGRSAAFAMGLTAVNPKSLLMTIPKNLMLIASGATGIAQTGVGADGQGVALAIFVVLGSLGPGVPLMIYLARGERSTTQLTELRMWMITHDGAIMTVLPLIIGVMLIRDGLTG